ncbi:NPCBM/NEW2 domain-containing protein [Deinococcus yavapaiensis]|uniref:N-acetylneuraminic acid mutarotase n=1 Tax=Deinococcus yavapaiensis KR-236 TaxID=694435 RepID=A0A318SFV1_9DEIO|nr:NPCBM/NEW2 domain-containing protein [Deinococcus yavapaiensis]PYE55746.1 N-acetylneuraminic acid mutarotase [Deinococcus yavapaiensis KR-236]
MKTRHRHVTHPGRLALLTALLIGCSQSPNPENPYANGRSYPWSDRLEAVGSDPYASGRDYSWTGPSVNAASEHDHHGLHAQGIVAGDNFLSDLTWTAATNAWGPVEKDKSNGEQATGDGRAISIRGQTFAKGLGAHANSTVAYALSGQCNTFTATLGLDDEVSGRGKVVYQVFGDGVKLYESAALTGTSAPLPISVNVSGKNELKLVVTDGGDGIDYDHADWAAAKVNCTASAPTSTAFVTDLGWSSATNGWGPVERDKSNGEWAGGDGRALSIRGQAFPKGLGTHAASTVTYNLGGQCGAFTATVGLDDEVGGRGSVSFQVFGDGALLYDSGRLTGTSAPLPIDVNVTGKYELKLVVTNGGDNLDYDHADWANAKLSCAVLPAGMFTYQNIANLPFSVFEAQGRVVNGKLYTFGGFDSQKACCTPTNRSYVYDPTANTWTALASMPDRGATHAGMTTDGTNVYYAGGYVADDSWTGQVFGSRAVWRYNVASNTYTRLPDLPVERAAGALEYLNGKLHYFGGTNLARTQDTAEHFVLDLTSGATSWTAAAPLPNPRNHLGSAVLGGRIYAIGGQRGHDDRLVTEAYVHAYDPNTNTWTQRASLPRGRSHITSLTFVLDGKILVVGGETSHLAAIADVTAYDPATNTWTEYTPLPSARLSAVGGVIGQGFVVTGGSTDGTGWRATPKR